jgi:hypothetical protein
MYTLYISQWNGIHLYKYIACNYVLKMKIFLTFMKFVVTISHVIPHTLNHVCETV